MLDFHIFGKNRHLVATKVFHCFNDLVHNVQKPCALFVGIGDVFDGFHVNGDVLLCHSVLKGYAVVNAIVFCTDGLLKRGKAG